MPPAPDRALPAPRRLPTFLLLICCGLLLAGGLHPLRAQTGPHRDGGLRAADYEANTFVPPIVVPGKTGAAARIEVTYHGFSAAAQAAFAYAVSIWEAHISTPVVIHIDATWEPLEEGVLGSAGPRLVANFEETVFVDTWYPTPLAEALAGLNFTDDQADIEASFNSDFDNWYFGLDGRPPAGTYDFVTVVLHEIAHGLGFTGSFLVDDGDEVNGDECPQGPTGYGCWGFGTQNFPAIYDHFTQDAHDVALLNTDVYPNPSEVLGDVLQSEAVFFDGTVVRTVNEDVPADLYVPSNFERGSSYSHLDEETFEAGTPNSLMTPQLARSEAIHNPGAITCAIFNDLGWALGDGCRVLLFNGLVSFDAAREAEQVHLAWTTSGATEITRFEIQQSFFGGDFETIATVPAAEPGAEPQAYAYTVETLPPGRYAFRLRQVLANGLVTLSPSVEVFIPLEGDVLISEVYPNPFTQEAHLTLVAEQRQRVVVNVYNTLGQRVAQLFNDTVRAETLTRFTFEADGLPSGVYIIHIDGVYFEETETAVLIR